MTTEAYIRNALRDCYDPEIPLNILDLGLLQSITLTEDSDAPGAGIPGVPLRFRATITLIPTTADESQQAQLAAQIQNRLAGIETLFSASVQFADTPQWTPAFITPGGRRILKLDQPAFPILNNRAR
jgi:metal-sulfur cluster biosynthetic enzyme